MGHPPHARLSGPELGLPRLWTHPATAPLPSEEQPSPTGVQQVPSPHLVSLWPLVVPQRPQGSDQFLLVPWESLAVTAQQLLGGCRHWNVQDDLCKLVLQSWVNSCFGASWAQR